MFKPGTERIKHNCKQTRKADRKSKSADIDFTDK